MSALMTQRSGLPPKKITIERENEVLKIERSEDDVLDLQQREVGARKSQRIKARRLKMSAVAQPPSVKALASPSKPHSREPFPTRRR
jgi:hypothetical protein